MPEFSRRSRTATALTPDPQVHGLEAASTIVGETAWQWRTTS